MNRRRVAAVSAVIGLVLLIAGVQELRERYYIRGIIRTATTEFLTTRTRLYIASSAEIDRQIRSAPFADSSSLGSPATGPLSVLDANPRYFTDGSGRAVYLTGSHTWSNFQESGGGYPPPEFDYTQYLDFLEAHGHNFFRLWVWEGARWALQTSNEDYWFHPMGPFVRSGTEEALDGKPQWDVSQFDQEYFDRLRRRVALAQERGMYVAVMLFNGWSTVSRKGGSAMLNSWLGHPFHRANNVNDIDGDPDRDESGEETHELAIPAVLAVQEAYVRKVIDTLNDLDNVLYEISNESHVGSEPWQYHMIDFIKDYQATKLKQHPVGMTVTFPEGSDADLFASNADWISPRDHEVPPPADGRKVIIADTDHIWGIGGDRAWVWQSLTRGVNPIFMDGYDGAGYGVGGKKFDLDDPQWISLRRNLGYARAYAERIDLANARPDPDICSTGFCLVIGTRPDDKELLVYVPENRGFEVDLSDIAGELHQEWFDPETGTVQRSSVLAGGGIVNLTPPFAGDAMLYLHR